MKKYLKIMSLAVVILTTVSSCDLNKYPFDSIEQSQAFKTVKDATTFDNGMYNLLRGRVYGIFLFSTDVQADLLNATKDFGNRNGAPHKWTDFNADDYTIRDTWSYYYVALANVNNFLGNVDNIIPGPKDDATLIPKYKGEAYLLRAYYYHQLILRYAKAYDPATASTDPGVPLVLTFNVTLQPKRSTVAEVYTQILADITQAKTLLTVAGTQSSIKLTKDCVTALEARVALCMQNWTLAASDANAVITSGTYPLITTAAALKTMWVNDVSSEVIFQPYASNLSTEFPQTNNIFLGLNPSSGFFTPDFVPEQWVIDMYDNADLRKAVYLDKKTVYISGASYPNVYCVNKYPGNPVLFTGANTNYAQKPKVFRVAELYLISAEASAQTPANAAAALATLNVLRGARGIPALTGLTGTALMSAIQDERLRELFCEGFRLDDLKRWKMGFSRKPAQNVNIIVPGADYDQKTVLATDPKFVWGIPTNELTTNPNIGVANQNPGW